MVELVPTTQEMADLQVREKDACEDAREAKEKVTALIERTCMDAAESERL